MDDLKPNNILLFNPNQLSEVRKPFGYDDHKKLNQDIELFEDWIKKQNHFKIRDFDREYLERYIIYNKGSIEKAKKHFDRLCTLRNLMPDFLMNIDMKNEFGPIFNCCHINVLPKPTSDNYRVMIFNFFGDDDKAEFIHLLRYIVAIVEYMLCNDYCFGYEILTDTRNLTFGFMSKFNPILIRKAMTLIVESMGMRIKNLHFINGSKFFDAVLSLIKQGLSEKLSKRIRIHSSFDTIYEYIPRKILPKDYGGEEISVEEIHNNVYKEVRSDEHIARLKYMESASTDESCRLSSKFNEEYSGMPGSFKTLCVD